MRFRALVDDVIFRTDSAIISMTDLDGRQIYGREYFHVGLPDGLTATEALEGMIGREIEISAAFVTLCGKLWADIVGPKMIRLRQQDNSKRSEAT